MDKILIGKEVDGESWYTHDFVEMLSNQNKDLRQEIESKNKVINDLLKRIASLEYEVEKQDRIIEEINKYVDKMSYETIVDNPKKDLSKMLRK